jgi:hypothetical protein
MIRRHRDWVATARDVKAAALGCPVRQSAGSSTRHSSVATAASSDETAIRSRGAVAKRPGTQQAYDLAGLQSAVERTSAIAGQEHCAERLDRVKPLGRLTFRAIRRCLGIELATVFQGCHGPSRRCSLSPMVPRQSGTDNVAYRLSFSARCPSIAPRLSAVAVNIYGRQRKPGSRHFALADSALSLQCRHRLQPATVPYASRVRPSNYQEVTP